MAIDRTKPPGFFRRMAAIFYDSLLLLAVLFLATMIILPFNHEQAVAPNTPLFSLYLLAVSYLFFGWFWTHGGQTLGMVAWKIRVENDAKRPLTWAQALKRFVLALLSWGLAGSGFVWILFNSERHALHDKLSQTYLVWHIPDD